MKHDPKSIGVPNICFSLVEDSKRYKKYKKQRIKRGFDDSELWSLTNTICSFTIPRLKAYLKLYSKVCIAKEYKVKHIKRLIKAFELLDRDNGLWSFTKEEEKQVQKGLKSFHKIFMALWY